jgi:hypothetical protein
MILQAILKINPNAQANINGEDINQIEWLNGTTPISKNLILEKIKEIKKEYDSKKYQRDRALTYPSIQEQLDMIYWDKINNTTKWEEAINAVKIKYPK